MSSETKPYPGVCACDKIHYTVLLEVDSTHFDLMKCNCIVCHKDNRLSIKLPYNAADTTIFTLTDKEDQLGVYEFASGAAKSYFCKHCGVGVWITVQSKALGDFFLLNAVTLKDVNFSTRGMKKVKYLDYKRTEWFLTDFPVDPGAW